jgi:hypothetical protein
MYLIDRTAAVVRIKKPFLDWVNSLPGKPRLTLKALNRENHVFLLPEHDTEEELDLIIQELYPYVCQIEVNSFCRDQTLWPQMNYDTFLKWFDLQVHSMVFDPYKDTIQKEEFLHY